MDRFSTLWWSSSGTFAGHRHRFAHMTSDEVRFGGLHEVIKPVGQLIRIVTEVVAAKLYATNCMEFTSPLGLRELVL